MRVLSLFSGGGLGDYGLTLAGMEIVGQVEIDDYCQKILKLRWPDVPKWTDIKNVRGEEVIEKCGRIDLVSGGFPCQDISVAGKRIGLEGERSGLWSEMWRLVHEIRPRFILIENVSALLYSGLDRVLCDIATIGYDARWETFPASAIGAPHSRNRVWIIAYPNSKRYDLWRDDWEKRQILQNKNWDASQGESEWKRWIGGIGATGEDVGNSNGRDIQQNRFSWGTRKGLATFRNRCEREIWNSDKQESSLASTLSGVANGLASRVDRGRICGNAQVVQVVEWIGKRIMLIETQNRKGE